MPNDLVPLSGGESNGSPYLTSATYGKTDETDRKLKLAHLREQYEAGLEYILDDVMM